MEGYYGSPIYMAPEIIEQKPYDGLKADVFSLGIILFTLVLGNFPFSEASCDDKLYNLLNSTNVTDQE